MARTERVHDVEDGTASDLRALWSRAEAADGVGAVSEAFRLAVGAPREGVVHLVRRDGDAVVGYAQVAEAGSPDAVAELVVDPAARRQGHGHALLDAALADGTRSVWAHGLLPAAQALARSAGLLMTRSLHRMQRPLTDADAEPVALPTGFSVRTFEPGRDDETWVRLNAAAFARHPEQGRLTVADLRDRMAQPWFDPAGLLLVVEDATGEVVAFHWTKVEPGSGTGRAHGSDPSGVRSGTGRAHGSGPSGVRSGTGRAHGSDPSGVRSGTGRAHGSGPSGVRSGTGEVYVVGVDPAHQGRGLGGPVTRLGLAHLARLGLAEVELYVDGDNTAARRTYQRLGFTDVVVDGQYTVAAT